MDLSTATAQPRRLLAFTTSTILSPFGYGKELVALGFAIWLISFSVTTAMNNTWLSENESQLAVTLSHPAISRIMLNPHEGMICLYENFTHVVAIDEARGDVLLSHAVPGIHRLELGCDPDGWSFLALKGDHAIEWWHSATGRIEVESPDGTELDDVTLSKSGRVAAAVTTDGHLATWRIEDTGELRRTVGALSPETDRILLSPNGEILAGKTKDNRLGFYRAADGSELSAMKQQNSLFVSSAWSANSEWFATGLESNRIRIFNVADGSRAVREVAVGMLPISIALSEDGRWLVASLSSGELRAWHDDEPVWSTSTYPTIVRSMDVSADSQRVICGGVDGRMLTYSTTTGTVVETKHTAPLD